MTKLNQILAIEKGVKASASSTLSAASHIFAKGSVLSGISRVYRPRDEEGEQLPPESTRVQVTITEVLKDVGETMARLFNITAAKDMTNCFAKASVTLDGHTVAADVPATYLLFLEKQLTELKAILAKLPVLDPSEHWSWSSDSLCWESDAVQTVRTKKIPRNHVKAEATDRHPAQVEIFYEDVPVGTWTTVKLSGAVPAEKVRGMLLRCEKLIEAVKKAREAANSTQVTPDVQFGEDIMNYLFSGSV